MSRELVKPALYGRPGTKLFRFDPSFKYALFIDPNAVSPDFVAEFMARHPECTVHELKVPAGKTLDDLLCVFRDYPRSKASPE